MAPLLVFSLVAGEPEREVALTRVLAAELSAAGLDVRSAEEIESALAFEGDKSSIGCTDQSCLAEIAGAYGARYVVFGQLARVGQTDLLSLQMFDNEAAKSVARLNERGAGVASFLDRVPQIAGRLVEKSDVQPGASVIVLYVSNEGVPDVVSTNALPMLGYIAAGVGDALTVFSVFTGLGAVGAHNDAVDADNASDATDALNTRDGLTATTWGLALVGGALVVGGLGLATFGGSE